MPGEFRAADEAAVERPFLLGVHRGMNADEAPSVSDVALEGLFLICVEHIARSVEENHSLEVLQVLGRECLGVIGERHIEAELFTQLHDFLRGLCRRGVALVGFLCEKQNLKPLVIRRPGEGSDARVAVANLRAFGL